MSAEAIVRSADPSDSGAICAIYNAAIEDRTSTFETSLRSAADFEPGIGDARFPLLVCETGGGISGWAGLAPYSDRECYAGIGEASVYVARQALGQGLGTMLVDALAASAAEADFHKIVGKLFTDNTASIRLCGRCGFISVGLHRRHGKLDGTWRDVLLVELLL